VTWGGACLSFLLVLGPYWSFPFLLISGAGDRNPPSWLRLAAAISIHTFGIVLMMCSDAQKYFTLRLRRGLITDGMFTYIRHPNYLGEMLLYGAYALLVRHYLPWLVLGWVWSSLFLVNMLMKEESLSRHPGWDSYKSRTGMLLPKLRTLFERRKVAPTP
jgi:protein-S-isoprenylcysteine O-methyltransferase Ste14